MLAATLQGFAIGGSLIIAIGGQNAFVIRQGVRGEHVFLVATICFLSDALLISIGAAGVGTLIAQNIVVREIAAWGGAMFLFFYGAKSAFAVWRPTPMINDLPGDAANGNLNRIVLTALAFTYLNPHVYLDTVVLIGGIAAQFNVVDRMFFAAGAICASLVWFFGLAILARKIAPFFRTTFGARLLDILIWGVMWTVATSLVYGEVSK